MRQDGVSFASIVFNASKVSRMIAKAARQGEYQFEPATLREIKVEGKKRTVFSLNLTDTILHGAVADLIEEAHRAELSPRVFSYRKGVSWWTPTTQFASYVRSHRKQHADLKDRGLYVLRRDIDSYTDSIPVDGKSQIWALLKDALDIDGTTSIESSADWSIVEQVVRPVAHFPNGPIFSLVRGVPTGQPISCVLFNMYLKDLDSELGKIQGAFYARYCDDILFAHPEAKVAEEAGLLASQMLSNLRIRFNAKKKQNIYLNDAGRPPVEWENFRGSTQVEFLGLQVSSAGTTRLSRRKQRSLLRELEDRAVRTAKSLNTNDTDRIGRTVCSVINRALEPNGGLFQQRSATLVRKCITDRQQLGQIDYLLARLVLYAVTGSRNVRMFRSISYQKIRNEWGLVSLLHSRNKWGKSRQ